MKNLLTISLSLLLLSCGNKKSNERTIIDSVETITNQKRSDIIIPTETLLVIGVTKLIVIPSKAEIDSLKLAWNEEKFYTIADDENSRLASIYEQLDEDKKTYKTTNKAILFIEQENKTIKKSSLPYSWGVMDINEVGDFTFQNTSDFLLSLQDKTATIRSDKTSFNNTTWFLDCESNYYVAFSAVGAQFNFNGKFKMNTILKEVAANHYEVYFTPPLLRPIPENLNDYKQYALDKPIANLTYYNNSIVVKWIGFHHTVNEELIHTDNPFDSNSETVSLKKCN